MTKHGLVFMLLALVLAFAAPVLAADPVKVVYHLNEGIPQATRAMRNISNHLSADPTAKIVVVARMQARDGFVYLKP